MKKAIKTALSKPTAFSPAFHAEVNRLAMLLNKRTQLHFDHLLDEMYNCGDRLSVWLCHNMNQVDRMNENAKYGFSIYISSKGKLCGYLVTELRESPDSKLFGKSMWVPTEPHLLPEALRSIILNTHETMMDEGYCEVDDETGKSIADGYRTQMDGCPAMVWEILFGEAM